MENKQLPFLQHIDAIQSICKPLFDNTRVTYFSHSTLKNNQFFEISTHYEFTEAYFLRKYYHHGIHALKNIPNSLNVVWDLISVEGKTKEMIEYTNQLGFGHTFSIIKNDNESIECFHFSGQLGDNAINQQYQFCLDFLYRFTLYYKETVNSHKNLRRMYETHFVLSEEQRQFHSEQLITEIPSNLLDLNKYVINFNKSAISKREIHCLYLLNRGKTLEDIAIILNISHRTVKEHIKNIKDKLNCQTLFQLGEAYHRLELWRLMEK